jgi:glycine/D-amino acid oxidase-like deaminating enzyme
MPFSADGEPIIGELSFTAEDKSKVSSGLYIISGLGGSGMMRGAMGGYLLAQSIAGDESEKVVAKHMLDPVSPNRFWSS